jgi:hypothetical protein
VEDFYKTMNARPEIKDALLLKKMNHWLLRARCPQMNPRVPTWKARKNYWSLVRRYPALAAAHHLTVTSVF